MRSVLFAGVAIAALAGSTAWAADLPVYEEMAPVAPIASVFTWSGFYVGVHAGGAWDHDGDDDGCNRIGDLVGEEERIRDLEIVQALLVPIDDYDDEDFCADREVSDGEYETNLEYPAFDLDGDYVAIFGDDDDDDDGFRWLAGAQLGYNQQYGRLVLGVEADFSWLGGGDDDDLSFGYFHEYGYDCLAYCLTSQEGTGHVSSDRDINWLATLRGRIGGALGAEGRLLLYATGGLAVAGIDGSLDGSFDDDEYVSYYNVDWCDDCSFGGSDGDDDDYEFGFAVGLGAEYAFTNNLSLGAEYLYVGFHEDDDGDTITFYGDDGRSFDVSAGGLDDLHIVRARLNWRFGPGGS